MSIICPTCQQTFTRNTSLTYHIENNACKTVKRKFECKYCDKKFTVKNSMYRHMRETCQEKEKESGIYDRLVKLEKENAELKKDVRYLKSSKSSSIVNNNTINGDLNINTGTVNNITIVAYGKEDMDAIDRDDIIRALKTGFNSTKHLTEVVHFNPKYPNYSNIRRSNFNMKNKLMFHNGTRWVTTSDPHMIDDLYNRKRDFIEENIDYFRDGLTKGDMTRLNRWLDIEDDDRRIAKIKDELRELLFNRKDISEINEKQMNIEILDVEDLDIENEDRDIHVQPPKIIIKKKRKTAPRNGRYRKAVARRAY
jgi:transcriptional regulator NrdR family protein